MLIAVIVVNEVRQGRADSIVAALVFGFGGLALGLYGARLFVLGKRRTAPTAEEKLAKDNRPPVLYLRAFTDDDTTAAQYAGAAYPLPVALNSEEEQLARVFDRVGPMVGLGRPGSPLPNMGAAREWVSDEEWQRRVIEWMGRSRLVLLRLAETDGVWWEIAKSREIIRPEQLVLLVPFGASDYNRLRPTVEELLGLRLPDFAGGGSSSSVQGLVMFDREGVGKFLPMERSWFRTSALNPISSEIQNSVQPLFDQLGVSWHRPGPAPLRIWVTILAVVTIVGIVVTLVMLAMGVDM